MPSERKGILPFAGARASLWLLSRCFFVWGAFHSPEAPTCRQQTKRFRAIGRPVGHRRAAWSRACQPKGHPGALAEWPLGRTAGVLRFRSSSWDTTARKCVLTCFVSWTPPIFFGRQSRSPHRPVQDCPAWCWRRLACSAGGDGGRSPASPWRIISRFMAARLMSTPAEKAHRLACRCAMRQENRRTDDRGSLCRQAGNRHSRPSATRSGSPLGSVHQRNPRICHHRGTVCGERMTPNSARRKQRNRSSRAHTKGWRSIGCYSHDWTSKLFRNDAHTGPPRSVARASRISFSSAGAMGGARGVYPRSWRAQARRWLV